MFVSPYAFNTKGTGSESASGQPADNDHLKIKKAWDTAMAPARSIPMNAFMMWMAGNSVQIFSILIVVMLLWNTLKTFSTVNQGE